MASIIPVPPDPPPDFFHRMVELVRRGGLLAVGTESSYALAAPVSVAQALERVVRVKERSSGKPLLVLIGERSQLDSLARSIPPWTDAVLDEFWPGPLTVVFPAQPGVSPVLTAGTGTIGVREPAPSFLRSLLRHTGPLTGTSANRSGHAPCMTAEEVEAALGRHVDVILDTGSSLEHRPSTLLSVVGEPRILREGPVSATAIQRVISKTGQTVSLP